MKKYLVNVSAEVEAKDFEEAQRFGQEVLATAGEEIIRVGHDGWNKDPGLQIVTANGATVSITDAGKLPPLKTATKVAKPSTEPKKVEEEKPSGLKIGS